MVSFLPSKEIYHFHPQMFIYLPLVCHFKPSSSILQPCFNNKNAEISRIFGIFAPGRQEYIVHVIWPDRTMTQYVVSVTFMKKIIKKSPTFEVGDNP